MKTQKNSRLSVIDALINKNQFVSIKRTNEPSVILTKDSAIKIYERELKEDNDSTMIWQFQFFLKDILALMRNYQTSNIYLALVCKSQSNEHLICLIGPKDYKQLLELDTSFSSKTLTIFLKSNHSFYVQGLQKDNSNTIIQRRALNNLKL